MKQHLHNTIGLILVLPLLFFFFYKSLFSASPYDALSSLTAGIESLQVKLHREMLRHRNSQLLDYGTLDEAAARIAALGNSIDTAVSIDDDEELAQHIDRLKTSIETQTGLIENFKTHDSAAQNSLRSYSRLYSGIGANDADGISNVSAELLGKLSMLMFDYIRRPERETALKIRPLLDQLRTAQDTGLDTLIDHSLTVIERLPMIDAIIDEFNTLNIETQISTIDNLLAEHQANLEQHQRIYNSMLFFSALYLLGYIGYMFLILRRNKNTLLTANVKLNREVAERTRTEKTLYRLVKETSSIGEKDFVHDILFALYKALGYRYTYAAVIAENTPNEVKILGLVESGSYRSGISFRIENSPCEEVLRNGRLVHNRDFLNYYPDWDNCCLPAAESYIGITIRDQSNRVKGLLAVADDKAIGNSNLAENILSLAAARISVELQRHEALQDSKRYHTGLESIDSWLLKLIGCAGDTDAFYRTACNAAMDIANASMAFTALLDDTGERYLIAAASGCGSEHLGGTLHGLDDGGLCSWTLLNRTPLRVEDVNTDMRARRQFIKKFRIRSAYVTPVFLNDAILGAIGVFRENTAFDTIDEQLIRQFTQRVQLAIANMKLVSDIATEKERAEFTLHSIGDAVITTDAAGRIEYMNHIAERLTGWQLLNVHNEPVQKVFRILEHDTREPMHNLVDACLSEGTSVSKKMTYLVNHNGSERSIESSMSPIVNASGLVEGAVIVFHDETERRRMECIIHHQATHDPLTGLINREQFNHELKQQLHHARTHDSEHVLCYLDLDRFKIVNDTCGQAAGDELLKQVTSRLHSSIRSGDTLGRLGGNEFGLILRNCPLGAATDIADKIIAAISGYEFIWEGARFTIGVSIGIEPITSETESVNDAMKHADAACYSAKHQESSCYYLYDQQDTRLIHRHEELHWASRISKALEQDRFRIHAQSICPLNTTADNTARIEILVRMEDEDGQLIPPAAFIPAAERYELMAAVDQYIIRETFRFIADTNCSNICVSINLSASSLHDDNLAGFIKQCTKEYNVEPRMICFDITETDAITNLTGTRSLIEELQSDGFAFALDDFGSKLTSFSYLDKLPVDYLKIDGSFVREMVDNRLDHAMVAAINQIGHIMGMKTIAEFVENADIIDKLRGLGVDYAQGYEISKPRPLTDATLKDMIRQAPFNGGLVSAS